MNVSETLNYRILLSGQGPSRDVGLQAFLDLVGEMSVSVDEIASDVQLIQVVHHLPGISLRYNQRVGYHVNW